MAIDDAGGLGEAIANKLCIPVNVDGCVVDAQRVCSLFPAQKATHGRSGVSDNQQHRDAFFGQGGDVLRGCERAQVQERKNRLELPSIFIGPVTHVDFEFAARDMPEDFHHLFIVDVRLVDSWITGREDDNRLLRDGGYVNMRRGGRLGQESENRHKCRVD